MTEHSLEELKRQLDQARQAHEDARTLLCKRQSAYNVAKWASKGVLVGQEWDIDGNIYLITSTEDDSCPHGRKKTKTGWHKSEQYIYGLGGGKLPYPTLISEQQDQA